MTIEEQVFQRKRFLPKALLQYGFQTVPEGYRYTTCFHDNEFKCILNVSEEGAVNGTVIDSLNDEEFLQLRIENFNGAYVNSIRSAYQDVLQEIAERCCYEVYFVSYQANRIADRIFASYDVKPDFPWGRSPHECSGTFRHADTQKWFALIMRIRSGILQKNDNAEFIDVMNLKSDPERSEALCRINGIYPAYHMNHKKWITVVLNDVLTDDRIMELVEESYRLTSKERGKVK